TGNRAVECVLIVAVEHQRAVVGDVTNDAARGPAVPEPRGAGVDGGAARVGVGAGEGRGAAARLQERAGADDRPVERAGVAAVERQRAEVVDRAAGDRAGGPAIADVQQAVVDVGRTGIAVVSGQQPGAARAT